MISQVPLNTSPIGIFDSGLGGLTVAKSVMKTLPNENIIYFGDTARVPYGIKSRETISRYAEEITRFLAERKVKMVLIACNSVSAVARESVCKAAGSVPVLDVIRAGTDAVLETAARKIAVIGTLATIGSGAYEHAIHGRDPELTVVSKACPLLVPLAEEGWTDNEIAFSILNKYLEEFTTNGVQSLILGCTHYPLFRKSIQSLFSSLDVKIIDSADAIAKQTSRLLEKEGLVNTRSRPGRFECFVTDRPQRFQELAERFLGRPISGMQVVNLS